MAQFNGSGPASSGLVYLLDNGNQRSYAGPPMQNLAQTIVPVATSGSNVEYVTGSVSTMIPNLGQTTSAFVNGYNSNPTNFCCMQQFFFTNGNANVACSPSTTYTYSIVYKCTSGYTHPNFMYRYEYTSGGSYVTEAGIFDTAKQISLGDGWFWAWNTFTTQSTTAQIVFRSFYYQYNVSDIFYMAKVMVTPGDYTQLNPRFWPALGTTRASTQVLTDPLGINTYNTINLNYTSSGTLTFNGTSNYIAVANNTSLQLAATLTLEAWVNPTSTSGLGNIMSKNENNGYRFRVQNGELWSYSNGNGLAGGSVPNGQWAHVVVTMGPSGLINYVNGVATASTATPYTPANVINGDLFVGALGIGSELFHGSIALCRIYNKVLTPTEIQQNFNATRGRYGI